MRTEWKRVISWNAALSLSERTRENERALRCALRTLWLGSPWRSPLWHCPQHCWRCSRCWSGSIERSQSPLLGRWCSGQWLQDSYCGPPESNRFGWSSTGRVLCRCSGDLGSSAGRFALEPRCVQSEGDAAADCWCTSTGRRTPYSRYRWRTERFLLEKTKRPVAGFRQKKNNLNKELLSYLGKALRTSIERCSGHFAGYHVWLHRPWWWSEGLQTKDPWCWWPECRLSDPHTPSPCISRRNQIEMVCPRWLPICRRTFWGENKKKID